MPMPEEHVKSVGVTWTWIVTGCFAAAMLGCGHELAPRGTPPARDEAERLLTKAWMPGRPTR